MLKPFTAVAAVCAVQTVRRHSRECHDLAAREYLIRVERRLMAMVLEEGPEAHSLPHTSPIPCLSLQDSNSPTWL